MTTRYFTFVVNAEGTSTDEAPVVNIFERYTGDAYNLDGRHETVAGTDTYALSITLAPAQIQVGAAALVTITARKNGQALAGQSVSVSSNAPSVTDVPSSVTTNESGVAVFEVIAFAIGAAQITASMVVDGNTVPSNAVFLAVVTVDAPEDYDATGYGQIVLSVEGPLAHAMQARVQRLSHQEQIRKFPTDTGLSRLSSYENTEVTFLPNFLQ